MQDILQAIEKYLIGAMPTAALFILLVIAYQFLMQGPLTAMLAKAPRSHRGRHGRCPQSGRRG